MPYLEVRKNGQLVKRRELDAAGAAEGYRIRLGEGVHVRLRPGESATHGELVVRVVADPAAAGPDGAVSLGAADTRPAGGTSSPADPGGAAGGLDAVPQIEGYEVQGPLGEGGMGVVWRAKQLGTNRQVALKLLGKGAFASERMRLRFEREVELSARLDHPGIARIYDSGVHRGVYYYAMELIEGEHLDRFVRENDMTQREVLALMRAVCEAVQHAHQRGVIHRDLKPSNILVTADGRPHVLDFGLARTFEDEDSGYTISVEGEIAGTPAFMAPEQAAGRMDQMDTRTDVYALGVILYRLATGRTPHEMTGTKFDVMRRIVEEDVRRPSQLSVRVSAELEALLLKALARDPEGRYASAGELAADLDRYLSGDPLQARAATTWYFLRKRIRKYRGRVALAGAMAAALIGVAVWAYVRVAQERNRAVDAMATAKRERAKAEAATGREREARVSLQAKHGELQQALQQVEDERKKAVDEAEKARLAKIEADRQRDLAKAESERADAERKKAEDEAERARKALAAEALARKGKAAAEGRADIEAYAKLLGRARQMIGSKDYASAIRILSKANPALRGWEWGRLRMLAGSPMADIDGGAYRVFMLPGSTLTSLPSPVGGGPPKVPWLLVSLSSNKVTFRDPVSRQAISSYVLRDVGGVYLVPTAGGRVLVSFKSDYRERPPSWSVCALRAADGKLLADKPVPGMVRTVGASPFDAYFAAGLGDGTVRIWHLTDWPNVVAKSANSFRFGRGVMKVCFSPKARHLAISAMVDNTTGVIDVRDYTTGRRIWHEQGKPEKGTFSGRAMAFSPDGAMLAADWCGTIRLWNAKTGKAIPSHFPETGKPETGGIEQMAFSPDGALLAVTTGRSPVATVYDVASGKAVRSFHQHAGRVSGLVFLPGSRTLVTACEGGMLQYWPVDSESTDSETRAAAGFANAAFLPDGKRVATGGNLVGVHPQIKIWDLATWKQLATLPGYKANIRALAVSPTGGHLAATGDMDHVVLYELATSRAVLKLSNCRFGHPAFSPDGKVLAVMSSGARFGTRLYDTKTGTQVAEFKTMDYGNLRFSPDGTLLAMTGGQRPATLLDARTGRVAAKVLPHEGTHPKYHFLEFSPDGGLLAIVDDSGTIRLWDVKAKRDVRTFGAGVASSGTPAFSRDGRRLVTSTTRRAGGAVIWDVASGQELLTLPEPRPGPLGRFRSIEFSHDGRRLLIVDGDGRLVVYWAADWRTATPATQPATRPAKP